MSAGAIKPSSTPLFDPAAKQQFQSTKGEWIYEFSNPGAVIVATSPGTRCRVGRTLRTLAYSVSGSGSFTLVVRKNGTAVNTYMVTGGSFQQVNIALVSGDILTVEISGVATPGLSNLWIGFA